MMTHISHHPTSRRFSFAFALTAILTLVLTEISAPCQSAPQPAPPPQLAPAPQPEFEAASIHMADSSPHSVEDLQKGIGLTSWSKFPNNRFFAHFMPLKFLISIAYGVDVEYIQDAPNWLDSQLYDIEAKVEGDALLTREQMQPLLQNLLEQRFHLTVHRGQKEVTGYDLVVAKGGPKLQPPKGGEQPYGYILPDGIQDQNATVQALAGLLKSPAGGPVVDKTGITGKYDFNLKYATANHPDPNLPDLFTAVQEQFGLKLVPQKISVDILVIDHVDKIPTEN
jgi:uncharacterized protein (TIGR03435 family)